MWDEQFSKPCKKSAVCFSHLQILHICICICCIIYHQLTTCGHSAIMDTLIILKVAKSQAKIKMQRRLATMNLRLTVKVKKKNKTYQRQ